MDVPISVLLSVREELEKKQAASQQKSGGNLVGHPIVIVVAGVAIVLSDVVVQVGGITVLFTDVAHAYRQLEQEFVKGSDDGEIDALETKRQIAESIMRSAHAHEQPFEICRDNWNALVELGFSGIEQFCSMAWYYGSSCLFRNGPRSNDHAGRNRRLNRDRHEPRLRRCPKCPRRMFTSDGRCDRLVCPRNRGGTPAGAEIVHNFQPR